MLEHNAACKNVVVLTRDHFVAYLSAGDPSLMQIKAPRGYPCCEVAASMHVLMSTVGACKSRIRIGKTTAERVAACLREPSTQKPYGGTP
jgi:hypothetical protein